MPKYYFGIVVTVVYSSTSHFITTDIGDKAIAVSEAYLPRVYVHIIFEMTFFFFYLFSEYPHYELLGPQHLSLQRQISCYLITPPPEAPAQVHDWNDTAVSGFLENYDKKKKNASQFQGYTTTAYKMIFVSQQQSWSQGIPDVSLGHSLPAEAPEFYSILPPQKTSKGNVEV